MKFAGVFIIIMAAFTLGYSRRKTMLKGERLLMQLRSLAGVIRSNIEFEYDSPLRCIGRAAAGEGASCLEFLSDALKKTDEGAALCDALRDAFGEWEDRNAMSLEVGEDVAEYFGALATAGKVAELSRCDYIMKRLDDEIIRIRDINASKRGYYETVYTLAGAAVAIALV